MNTEVFTGRLGFLGVTVVFTAVAVCFFAVGTKKTLYSSNNTQMIQSSNLNQRHSVPSVSKGDITDNLRVSFDYQKQKLTLFAHRQPLREVLQALSKALSAKLDIDANIHAQTEKSVTLNFVEEDPDKVFALLFGELPWSFQRYGLAQRADDASPLFLCVGKNACAQLNISDDTEEEEINFLVIKEISEYVNVPEDIKKPGVIWDQYAIQNEFYKSNSKTKVALVRFIHFSSDGRFFLKSVVDGNGDMAVRMASLQRLSEFPDGKYLLLDYLNLPDEELVLYTLRLLKSGGISSDVLFEIDQRLADTSSKRIRDEISEIYLEN